ncbi:hypothetical protein ACFLRN_10280 [Thermoproteota archaeon]
MKFDEAMKFINFLVSDKTQKLFAEFGLDDYGLILFNPAVEVLEENTNPKVAEWIKESAFIDGTECPTNKRYNVNDLTFLNALIVPIL